MIDVDRIGYTTAWRRLQLANQDAAVLHDLVADALVEQAGMAGDAANSSQFAAAYDDAARRCVAALRDVVDACCTLGRVTWRTSENYADAERSSVLTAVEVTSEPEPGPDSWIRVEPAVSVTVRGSDPSSLPGWADTILDHVSDFVWPDADTDRLRTAAGSWRTAAERIHPIVDRIRGAVDSLWYEQSPEVPLAADTVGDLAGALDALVEPFGALARACDDYADDVEARRGEILDLCHDLLRDAVLIQAAGILLSAVTAGGGSAAATTINVVKIGEEAYKFRLVLETLRAGSAAYALALSTGTEAVLGSVSRVLARFRVAPAVTPSLTSAEKAFEQWAVRFTPGWLRRLEETTKSHVVREHVGRTLAQLRLRLANGRAPEVSTFTDEQSAEQLIEAVLRGHSDDIVNWLAEESKGALRLNETFTRPTGVTLARSDDVLREVKGVRVVLFRDESMSEGFRVHTAFPQPEDQR